MTQDSYLGQPGTPPSLHRYFYAYSNPLRFVDLMGYSAWEDIKHGGGEFFRVLSQTPNIIGSTLKQGAKSLPTITHEVSKVPDQVFKDVAPESTIGQLAATAGHVGLKMVVGAAMSPVDVSAQTVTFAQDPRGVNVPVLGPVADNLARTSSDFIDNPNFDTGLQVVGATSSAVLVTLAPIKLGRSFEAPGFKKPIKISVEDPSGSTNKIAKPTDDYSPDWNEWYKQNPNHPEAQLRSVGAKGLDSEATVRLRHYTSRSGSKGIETDQMIKASDQNKVFFEKAKGKPLSKADAETKYLLDEGHGRDIVETDVSASQVTKETNPLTGKTEYTVKGDVPLTNQKIIRRN